MEDFNTILRFFVFTIFFVACGQASNPPDDKLVRQLEDSRYLRLTMKLCLEDAGLTRWYEKDVLDSRSLPLASDFGALRTTGPGTLHVDSNFTISGLGSVRLDTPIRGFHAILQGKAKAAFILSHLLNDKKLNDIATRQMEYIVGYNPFAMSTIYGDGYDFPPLYGAYAGDVVGAVPVGIQTFENDDEPYMPMQNNCTYKEIWTHTTARMMWLIAELFNN